MAPGEEARPHRTAQGIGIIMASVLTMAFADAVVKLVSGHLTVWQVFAARSLVAVPILIALLRPGTDAFSWFTLLPLLGAALYALAMVLTRSKGGMVLITLAGLLVAARSSKKATVEEIAAA